METVKVRGCFVNMINWFIGIISDVDLTFKKNNQQELTSAQSIV